MRPGARSDVHNIIRRPHGIFVMLHHKEGIPQIPQILERGKQLVIVSLVQPDRRLIQDVTDATEPRSDLGCQPDALRLPSRKGGGCAGERQIIQSHVNQKADSRPDLF